MALWDRFLRIFLGTLVLMWGFAGGPAWAYLSFFVIATGAWGFDPFYAFFKTGTLKKG